MWTCQIKFNGQKGQIGGRALKYKIDLFGFPLSYSYKEKYVEVNISGNLFGDENKKKQFIKSMKNADRVTHFEINENFFIGTIQEPRHTQAIYSSKIIHLSPAHIDKNGYEIVNIGSFSRIDLMNAINTLKLYSNFEIIFLKEKKIKTISFFKQNPILTEKQKEAMQIALVNGYYSIPRKIELKQLAKIMKCAYSTYQVHLRKAESKLMPSYFQNSDIYRS
jgi:predicted DNA binding protein